MGTSASPYPDLRCRLSFQPHLQCSGPSWEACVLDSAKQALASQRQQAPEILDTPLLLLEPPFLSRTFFGLIRDRKH